jgi:HK97 family phage portal protein
MQEGNQNRLFTLEAGMKYQQISLSPNDIELLDSRRFQVEEVARFFGVPSVLINDTNAGTTWGSGIQQIVEGWFKLGLRPHLERLENSAKTTFFRKEDAFKYEFKFDFNALLRSDRKTRMESGKTGIQGGMLTPDEVRKEEGLPPMPGGDQLFLQAQMTPIDQLPINNNSDNMGTTEGDTENE